MLKHLRDPIWQFFGFVATVVLGLATIALANPTFAQRWWLPGLLAAAALIALVAVLRLWRFIVRALGWVSQQIKRFYLRMLWHLVIRPAKDHLNVMVSPGTGRVQVEQATDLREGRKLDEAEPIELSGGTVRLRSDLGSVQLVAIPAGEFSMGGWTEQPVYLDAFYIAQWPITNVQYRYFIYATGHESPSHWSGPAMPPHKRDHPVVHVSWHDARSYCNWLSRETGRLFRLPTEAEWEKAAQGTQRRTFPWGDVFDESKCNTAHSGIGDTTPVGKYSAAGVSRYGAAEMAGNVWEWTSSLDKDLPYDPDDGREDPDADGDRILRGGSFKDYQGQVGCAYREVHNQPKATGEGIGFRIAVSDDSR